MRVLIACEKSPRKRNKYGNIKVTVDGIKFDSKREADRYIDLKLLGTLHYISELRMQYKIILLHKVKELKQREIAYFADFRYIDNKTGNVIIEDVKSKITRKEKSYVLKKKLLLAKIHNEKLNWEFIET